jgi:ceramide synthetase
MQGHKGWNRAECRRVSQTCTSLLFFVSSALIAYRVLLQKEWLFSRQGWTIVGEGIDRDYKLYYLLYAARFFSDLVSIFFEDRKTVSLVHCRSTWRKTKEDASVTCVSLLLFVFCFFHVKQNDFYAAFVHHLVTLGLVLGSAFVGHTRYGGIIMFFFDWADIPLLSAKICKYLSKHQDDAFQFVANRLFETFAVTFFLTRNCYFNYVVYSFWMDMNSDWANRGCLYLLVLLVGLQTYWLYLIVMAVIRQHENGGVAEDPRDKAYSDKKVA